MRALAALMLVSCGGSQVPAAGPCSVAERGAIESARATRMLATCPGLSFDDCNAQHPEIAADYQRQRKEFVECSGR